MKKLLIALVAIGAVSVVAYNFKQDASIDTVKQDSSPVEYTVINQSSKASPAGVFAQAVRKAVDGKWHQSSNCTDATVQTNLEVPKTLLWFITQV